MSDILFQPLGIATGDMFYGREEQMRLVMEGMVSAAFAKPFYVVGGRRSGKTSFLRELSRRLQTKDTPFVIPVYVDLNDYTPQSEEEFYRACIECFGEAIQDELQHENEILTPTEFVQRLNTEMGVNSVQRAFENTLRMIVDSYPAKRIDRVVFLIDEFDRLMQLNENSVIELLSHLRALLLNRPIKGRLAMTFAGSSRPIQIAVALGSPFFMALELIPLMPLEAADAKRLISEPLLDSDQAREMALVKSDWIEWVYELSGGHPFLIHLLMQCLCGRMVKAGLGQDSVFEQCKLRLSSTFEAWYSKLEVIEQQLCLIIAKAQFGGLQTITEQDLVKDIAVGTITIVDLRSCLRTLMTVGLVRSGTNDNLDTVYSISSAAFLDWLRTSFETLWYRAFGLLASAESLTDSSQHKPSLQTHGLIGHRPVPKVFISYVRQNSEIADKLAEELRCAGVTVWLDRDKIMPGERWQDAIRQAIREGDYFIACFSAEYVARSRTYMHTEIALAIEMLEQMPTNRIWFIPVLLSDCEIPDRSIGAGQTLQDLQWEPLYRDWARSVRRILKSMGVERP